MYEIIDEKGVIHSSKSEDEIQLIFDVMTKNIESIIEIYGFKKKHCKNLHNQYFTKWTGDLKLVKIIDIFK